MKTLSIFSALFLFGSLAFMSCQDVKSSEHDVNHSASDDSSNYEIPERLALEYIQKYERFADSINQVLSAGDSALYYKNAQILVDGAWTNLEELRKILDQAAAKEKSGEADSCSLHIMLGIMPKSGKDSTHIIYCLESFLDNVSQDLMFFDFVRPCPTSCPSWMFTERTAMLNKKD